MEANGASQESRKENKHCSGSVEMCPNEGIKHSFKECFSFLLESIADFGSELKMKNDVLSIFVNVSALNFTDLKPLHVYDCLQQYMVKLESVSANLKLIVDADSESTPNNSELPEKSNKDLTATSEEDIVVDTVCLPAASHKNSGILKAQVDDSTVQIKAGKAEIERRISAFIERKQLEINENNVREFCNVINCNQENSCARTDAVFTPYPGFKSHVKVTRVVNTYGPQTRAGHSEQGDQQQIYSRDCGNPAIEERLHNIEAHLKLTKAGPVPQSVYQRLKKVEDRILELEGLSPEYFHSTGYLHKRSKASVSQSYSLSELDGKISAVKTALLKRANEFQSRDVREFPL